MPDVRPATNADVGPLSAALARAFHDDPPFEWMFPNASTRPGRAEKLFRLVLKNEALAHGAVEVVTDGEEILGGAIWFPPTTWPVPVSAQLRALPAYLLVLGRRFGPASELMAAVAKAHVRTPHWYLYVVGVDPAHQGRGIGGRLLRSRLDRIDAAGEEAYLESSKPANVPLYKHLGFAARPIPDLPEGVPPITPMYRPFRRPAPRS